MAEKHGGESLSGHEFEELIRHYNNQDFDKALKSANLILKDNSSDQKALHCKAVCLIQLSKFTEAVEVVKNVRKEEEILLVKVYCLYRLGQFSQIITLLPVSNAELPLELKEIKAQTLYKLERYEECLELYKDLLKKQRDDLESERQSNLLAVLTHLHFFTPASPIHKFTPSAQETYELLFNAAALDMARGDYSEAEKKLCRAQLLFQQFAKEEQLSADKIKAEMITLKSQLLSVLLRKKRQQAQEKPSAAFNLESVENNFLNQFAKLKKKTKKDTDALSPKSNPTGKTSLDVVAKKKRSKRKPRLPKNFDPNVKPDPERWLPKIERSTYKKKKDKRGNIGKGTQGSTTPADLTSSQTAPSTPKSQHAAAAGAQPAGPRQQKPQAATKKQAKKRPRK